MGFWVAMTMNGLPVECGMPSTVTRPSSMTSRSAAWVLGLARLISSARTIVAKIGPGWNSKRRLSGSKIVTPVTSEGSRSGVNWIRLWVPWTLAARARASWVLPVPGHVLEQQVALGEQAGEGQPGDVLLAEDGLFDVADE
jgi:hypothetical protein